MRLKRVYFKSSILLFQFLLNWAGQWMMLFLHLSNLIDIMGGQERSKIKPGMRVKIVLKKDQRTGVLTEGVVQNLLTKSANHPHGIKVRLTDGQVGRVKEILS